ncbi:MAG: rRNA pseudouridine synthase, partial [Myxococcales bacterium]|nr:rRNA pseudouridine synthase [Myxococcales bacterium]
GLLLFSRDGTLTQRLLHPRRAVPRTYRATVVGRPDEGLVAALTAGVETAAGTFTAVVERLEGDTVELTVTEGKHRMVRRMLNNAGFPVKTLQRLRYGAVELGDLAEGEVAAVEDEAAEWALSLLG